MNFIAIIGIVESLSKFNDEQSKIKIRVEKPFVETDDADWFDTVEINLDKTIFRNELKAMEKGSIVGVKGRIKYVNNAPFLVGERVQVF